MQIFLVDNCVEDWRIALTSRRVLKVAVELLVCSICPLPAVDGSIACGVFFFAHPAPGVVRLRLPSDLFCGIQMFLRCFLVFRVIVLHCRLVNDAASRYIGALNRIHLDTRFVLKTFMTTCPGTVLFLFIVSQWLIQSWIVRACERYGTLRLSLLYFFFPDLQIDMHVTSP